LTLNGANTYTSGTTISAGTVIVGNANALGTSGTITLGDASSGARLMIAGLTINRPITVAAGSGTVGVGAQGGSLSGTITLNRGVSLSSANVYGGISGTGDVTIDSQFYGGWASTSFASVSGGVVANTFVGNLYVLSGATLNIGGGWASSVSAIPDSSTVDVVGSLSILKGANNETIDALTGNGSVTAGQSGGTLTIGAANGSGTFSGIIGGTGAIVVKTGTGTQTLSGKNSYSGGTIVSNGTLRLGVFNAITTHGAMTVAGGIYDLGGFGNVTNAAVTMSGGAISNGTLTASSYVLSGGTSYAPLAGNASLIKNGIGAATLVAANTYSGATMVSNGILRVIGDQSAATGATTVSGGALSGTGKIGGAVSLTTAGGINLLDGTLNNLTLNSTLDINGAARANNLYFDIGAASTGVDKLIVGGTTTVPTAGAAVITLNQLGGAPIAPATYTLIQGTTSMAAASQFSLATSKANHQTFSLGVSGNDLQLTVADATLGPAATTWSGTSSTAWHTAGNWSDGVPGFNSDVTFYSAAANLSTVLNQDFEIKSLTYNSGATTATTIAKGTGTILTIGGASGITVNAGSHTISANVGLGTNQTWTVGSGAALSVSGPVSDYLDGGSTLTKAGAGTLTLSGTNTYSGTTTITAGALSVSADINMGAVPASATPGSIVINGGTLWVPVNFTLNANRGIAIGPASGSGAGTINPTTSLGLGTVITLTYGGVIANNGSGTGALTLLGNLTLSGNNTYTGDTSITGNAPGSTLTLSGAGSLGTGSAGTYNYAGNIFIQSANTTWLMYNSSATQTLSGVVSGGGGLQVNGTGMLILSATNTYTWPTTLTAGSLKITNGKGLGGNNNTVNCNGGTLWINTSDGTLSNTYNVGISTATTGTLQLDRSSSGTGNTVAFGSLSFGTYGTGGLNVTQGAGVTSGQMIAQFSTASAGNNNGLTSSLQINPVGAAVSLGGFSFSSGNGTSATLIMDGTSTNNVVKGAIFDNGAKPSLVTKQNTSTWTLSGTNTYSGATTVNAGTLRAGIASAAGYGAFGTNSAVTVANAASAVLDLNGFNTVIGSLAGAGPNGSVTLGSATLTIGTNNTSTTFGGVISGTGNLVKVGTSTNTLSGVNLYTGTTTVSKGTLRTTVSNCLSDDSSVSIDTNAKMFLDFTGSDTVKSLKLGGKAMPKGVYGVSGLEPSYFSGNNGTLTVTTGPATGTLVRFF
jgi:autotransporter-associated beta strand protein